MGFWFGVIAVWLLVLAYNLYWYLKAKYFFKKFLGGYSMTKYKSQVREVFCAAGVSKKQGYVEPIPGSREYHRDDIAELCDDKRFINQVAQAFSEAEGTLKTRLLRTVNPLYVVFFFPANLLFKHIAVKSKLSGVLLSIFMWFAATVAGYFLEQYLDKLFLDRIALILPHWGGN